MTAGIKTVYIEPGSPWKNGYLESFNGKLRDELLSREIFTTLEEAKVLIEQWRREYNQVRPHSSGIQASSSRGYSHRNRDLTSGTAIGGRSTGCEKKPKKELLA